MKVNNHNSDTIVNIPNETTHLQNLNRENNNKCLEIFTKTIGFTGCGSFGGCLIGYGFGNAISVNYEMVFPAELVGAILGALTGLTYCLMKIKC